ncbi:hypothetical protein BS47DRAFT_736633 [Hydnum rufescens UP504]|uniref:Uncharacterized protein n=1 Tax=Hydnum rufescens UP504 TaxID=1448309 RepID=A0A9P6DMA2_9AGAM|nr:hypothetical protein BS47DRAFT_736633 [Hydnum rufescens UP504]
MEASVKFNILEDVGYPNVASKDRQTPDIIKTLASSAAMASFATSVKFDPTLEKLLADLINDVGTSTEEEIRKKYGSLIQAWAQLQELMLAYGSTRAFSDWFLKVLRHYGEGGREGFLGWLQLAGEQMRNIWNKFKKGKPREEIVEEFTEAVVELAEEPMKDPKRWEKISKAWNKFKGGVKAVFAHLALVACAAALIAVAAGQWGAVDPAVRVYLGLEAFAYALRGLKLFASTTLGKLIKTKLLDNKLFLERVGEWFSKEGVPKDIPGASILGKLVGKNVKVFLKRLGAVLAVAMVVVCAFDFKHALDTGDPLEIAESAIFLVLAIIDVAVVATGMVANVLGASAVAACAGPIGLAFAAVGLVVAIVFFIIQLLNPKPPPILSKISLTMNFRKEVGRSNPRQWICVLLRSFIVFTRCSLAPFSCTQICKIYVVISF